MTAQERRIKDRNALLPGTPAPGRSDTLKELKIKLILQTKQNTWEDSYLWGCHNLQHTVVQGHGLPASQNTCFQCPAKMVVCLQVGHTVATEGMCLRAVMWIQNRQGPPQHQSRGDILHPPQRTSTQNHSSGRMFWIQPTAVLTLGGTPGPERQPRAWLAGSGPWLSELQQCLPLAAAFSLPFSVPSSVSFPRPSSPRGTVQRWPPAPESQ